MAIFNQVVKGSGGGGSFVGIPKIIDANGKLNNSPQIVSGMTDVGTYALYYAYFKDTTLSGTADLSGLTRISGNNACVSMLKESAITGVNLSNLTTVSGDYGASNICTECRSLVSADVSSLETITSYSGMSGAFQKTGLPAAVLPKLTTVSGFGGATYMFAESAVATVDVGLLTTISGYNACKHMFYRCTALTEAKFYSLCVLTGTTGLEHSFNGCTSLAALWFYCLTPDSFGRNTDQFNNMLQGVTGCTVHFPSNIQSTIGSWTSVTNGFNGTNTTVLFDLPATVTLTGADTVEYTRNPKYDTATALAWKVGAYGTTNFDTPYYTSGTTDPVAGNTIYSDSACTTAVTTISSIA